VPTSAKWRLYVLTTGGATAVLLNELRLYDDTAVDLCTGGTASASSEIGGHEAASAFDGNDATYCQTTNSGTPWWFAYEFASAITPTEYAVTVGQGVSDIAVPLTWQLQYWDGVTWQIADAQTEYTWHGGSTPETHFYGLATKRSWRLRATSCEAGTNGIYIAEMQFRIVASGANQATNATRCRADHIGTSSSVALLANDGNPATDWYSGASALPHEWIYTFAAQTTVVEYVIQASAGFPEGAPKDFTLDYYDGSVWVAADTRTGVAAWSAGESRTYAAVTAITSVGTALGVATGAGVSVYRTVNRHSGFGAQKPSRQRRGRRF
jgi:hypothetical protein